MRTDLRRSRCSWRNPDGCGTQSSMGDRTWQALSSDQRPHCFHYAVGAFCPPLAAEAPQHPCCWRSSKEPSFVLTSQCQSKVKVKSLRDKNKSFLNFFVVQKPGVVIFSLSWCFQMFDDVNDLYLEENVSAENVSIKMRWEGAETCWSYNKCTWTRFRAARTVKRSVGKG